MAQRGLCRMCRIGLDPTLRGRSSSRSAVVDHLRPWRLRPDLVDDPANLQLICRGCHAKCDAIEKRLWPDADAIAAEKLSGEGG
ncbi:HNH endonuclease [Mameliella alba]|nr:HNH endonuclease [Mameliella alba]